MIIINLNLYCFIFIYQFDFVSNIDDNLRTKKVYDGVNHAAKLFPNAWLIMFITGVVKGQI